MAPTNVYDVTFPPDTQLANLLGSDLRNLALNVQQRMALISGTLASIWNPGADAQPANWTGLLYFATDTGQIFQWSGTAWVAIPPITGGIVGAAVNLTGQTGVIGSTVLYSVPAGGAGMYQVSFDITITTAGTGGAFYGPLSWNNGVISAAAQITSAISCSVLGNETIPVNGISGAVPNTTVFYSAASQNISWAVNNQGSITGSPVFNVRIRLGYLG
jgi:hypothetical protein